MAYLQFFFFQKGVVEMEGGNDICMVVEYPWASSWYFEGERSHAILIFSSRKLSVLATTIPSTGTQSLGSMGTCYFTTRVADKSIWLYPKRAQSVYRCNLDDSTERLGKLGEIELTLFPSLGKLSFSVSVWQVFGEYCLQIFVQRVNTALESIIRAK